MSLLDSYDLVLF